MAFLFDITHETMGKAAVNLQQLLHYNNCTSITALQQLHFNYCTTTTALQLLHYNNCTSVVTSMAATTALWWPLHLESTPSYVVLAARNNVSYFCKKLLKSFFYGRSCTESASE